MWFFNNFNRLARSYQGTDEKPDKYYSILPTVLRLTGDTNGRIAVDLGCGSGFFTLPIAERGADLVIGIDSSEEQLAIAREKALENTQFRLGNAFKDALPVTDVVVAPFIANYATNSDELRAFFRRIFQSLNAGGHAVFVVDLPEMYDYIKFKRRRAFGAVKWWCVGTSFTDGAMIQNHLYNGRGKCVCSLWAYYYTPMTIQFALQDAGFRNIRWHKPEISEEGLERLGEKFWEGYCNHPELGYITAEK